MRGFSRNRSKRTKRVLIVATATVVAAAGVLSAQAIASSPSAAPSGCQDQDRYTICTTFPTDEQPDTAISDEMIRHVDNTSAGDSIKVAMYLWELKDGDTDAPEQVAQSLVRAKERDVEVQVVLGSVDDVSDGTKRNKAFKDLMKDNNIGITKCEDACQDTDPNSRVGAMHNKFFLIQNGGSHNVLTTSSNLSQGQISDHQNMIVSRGDDSLYHFANEYWKRLYHQEWDGWGDSDKHAEGDYDSSKAYAFWRANGDPVLGNLNNVSECNNEHNKIWVSASMSGNERIRARLKELHDAGCDVRAVVTTTEENEHEKWLQEAGLPKAKVKDLPYNHNKLILIDAKYHDEWQQVVFTGSYNHLNPSGLRNSNDLNLRIIQPEVFQTYSEYYMNMFEEANA